MKFKKLLSVGLLVLSGMTAISQPSYALFKKNGDNKLVQLKGSDTILSLSQSVAEEFMKVNKKSKISVTGGGSGTGIAAKLNKTIDIALASREMKDAEWAKAKSAGLNLQEITVAYDGITIITNKSNPVKNLTTAQLRDIFMGNIKNWKDLGGADEKIIVLSRDSSSGTHVYFKEHVLRKGNEKGPEEYSSSALFLPSNEALKQQVENSKGAIAYIGMGYMDNSVKEVTVNGVEATLANVKEKKYPISRAVYWYADKTVSGTAKDLISFMLSPKGQEIVKKEGFVPVK